MPSHLLGITSYGNGKGIPINVPTRQYVYQDIKLCELSVNIRSLNYGAPYSLAVCGCRGPQTRKLGPSAFVLQGTWGHVLSFMPTEKYISRCLSYHFGTPYKPPYNLYFGVSLAVEQA
jgi:hypothetical protein